MAPKPNFRNTHILLADADPYLAKAIMDCLRSMGFPNIQHVKTAEEALLALRTRPISFLITEWNLKGTSGMALLRQIRRDPDSPNRTLPVIMLTGRGELPDVCAARDEGITEFLVKPFTVQTLFARIEQLIENPRSFVLAKGYVGPDRRRQGAPPPGVAERRVRKPKAAKTIKQADPQEVTILPPDHSLRQTLGSSLPLSRLITPEVLAQAQQAIDAMANESLTWVRDDLKMLEAALLKLRAEYHAGAFDQLKDSALSIKSRAGTFGYRMASDVARLLYLFLSVDFLPTHPKHLLVIQKYLEVLKIIFAQNIKERTGVGNELYSELMRLTAIH